MTQLPSPSSLPPSSPSPTPASRLVTVHGVNWHNVLDFTHLFHGFRLAINPAKLFVALLAITFIYTAGRVFDAAWGPQANPGEISEFRDFRPDQYRQQIVAAGRDRPDNIERLLRDASTYDETLTPRIATLRENPSAAYRALKAAYRGRFLKAVQDIHERRVAAEALAAEREKDTGLRIVNSSKTPAEIENDDRARAASRLQDNMTSARMAVGNGIFDTFLLYEIAQFDQLVENTLTFVRVSPVRSPNASSFGDNAEGSAVSGGLLSKNPDRLWRSDTVAGCIANMTITAPRWLFTGTAPMYYRPDTAGTWAGWFKMVSYRGLYLASLVAFAVFSLLMLAFAGASISRLSALELAGVERVPLKDVFAFALRRLWVFVKAPTAPFLILLVLGLVMAFAGMIGAIPFVGEVLLGIFFVVFLGIAFILMLLLLGILGGFNLLYPTVAVEGSDAFDAMSRAFAYVYARPWRLLFYTVTALIYGAITFLFVSFAVYLILLLTHTFVGWGTNFFGYNYGSYSGLPKIETLWPEPRFMRLVSPINWQAMSWPEYFGALFLHFWVFFLITAIGAYVISYYYSTHTIIYLLLRRSVDGQGIREVYQEESAAGLPLTMEAVSPAAEGPTTGGTALSTPLPPSPPGSPPPPSPIGPNG